MSVEVDARGLSCPQPVILMRRAMKDAGGEVKVIVDSATQRDNCTRAAEMVGWNVATEECDDTFVLTVRE